MGKTVTYLGELGCGNFGADASFFVLADHASTVRPGSTAVCSCWDPDRLPIRYRSTAEPLHRRSSRSLFQRLWGRLRDPIDYFRLVRRSDLVAVAGGGMLEAGLGVNALGRPLRLLLFALACLLTHTELALIDVGATELPTPLSASMMGFAATRAAYRSYRDQGSREAVRRLDVDVAEDAVYADVVFAMPFPPDTETAPRERPRLAFGVLAHATEPKEPGARQETADRHLASMVEIARGLVRAGFDVSLTPGDELDIEFARAMAAELSGTDEGRYVETREPHSLSELLTVLTDIDVVLASRYHGLVAGILAGRATGALAYSDKFDSLLGRAGQPPAIDVTGARTDEVVALCLDLLARRPELERSVRAARVELAEAAHAQLDDFTTMLGVSAGPSGARHGRRRSEHVTRDPAPVGNDPA